MYEYYEESLGECAYYDPQGSLIPSNRLIAMYHSETATSVKTAVSRSLLDPSGVIRRVFATQSLSMGVDCKTYEKLFTGVFHVPWKTTIRNVVELEGMICPQELHCYMLPASYVKHFVIVQL